MPAGDRVGKREARLDLSAIVPENGIHFQPRSGSPSQEVVDPFQVVLAVTVPDNPVQIDLHHVEAVKGRVRKLAVDQLGATPVVVPHLHRVDGVRPHIHRPAYPRPVGAKRGRRRGAGRGDDDIVIRTDAQMVLPQPDSSGPVISFVELGQGRRRHVLVVGPDIRAAADDFEAAQQAGAAPDHL